jgi:hypothetical protein
MVQVHYDEGVAIHIGPEPCVVVRKDGGEASVGEGAGQPLSRGAPGDRQEVDGASPSRRRISDPR